MRLLAFLLLLATPGLAWAQGGSYPDLLADLQRNRDAVLAYIDAGGAPTLCRSHL
jgi:hypothetical protein